MAQRSHFLPYLDNLVQSRAEEQRWERSLVAHLPECRASRDEVNDTNRSDEIKDTNCSDEVKGTNRSDEVKGTNRSSQTCTFPLLQVTSVQSLCKIKYLVLFAMETVSEDWVIHIMF